MPNQLSSEKRSELMARTRSENSKAELLAFNFLQKNKIYFQRHYKKAPGSPDIALPRKKKAVFIDGDFWHGRRLKQTIKLRGASDYWSQKVIKNVGRDRDQIAQLVKNGWKYLRVWESDINRKRTREENLEKIKKFLTT